MKTLKIALAALLCMALLTGCGSTPAAADPTAAPTAAPEPAAEEAPAEEAAPAEAPAEEAAPAAAAAYVFEFEDLSFEGRKGAGLSGASNGKAMILCGNSEDLDIPEDFQPSNDYYVSYTYSVNSYTFEIESSVETDVDVVLRMNSEIGAVKYDQNAFAVVFNGESLNYKPMTVYPIPNTSGVTDSHYFADYTLSVKGHLIAGANTVTVTTLENTLLNGTNFAAPQLDCMKLVPAEAGAVLTFTNQVSGNY